jgi:hypothetical protein
MKAEELRLGNLVSNMNPRHNDSVLTIESIGDNHEVNVFYRKYLLSELEPIPLTEEWLLKFGFDKVGIALTSIAIAPLNLPCTFNLPNTPFSFCQGKLILTTGTGDFCVNIEYVHQLQNLYFVLTGEELKQQE